MYSIYCHLLVFFAIWVLCVEIVSGIPKKNDETSNLARKYLDRFKKQNDELKTRNAKNFKTKMSKAENLEYVGEQAKKKGMESSNQAEYIQNCALLKSFGALKKGEKCKEIPGADETFINDRKMKGSKHSGEKIQKTDSVEFSEHTQTASDTRFRGSGHKIKLDEDEKNDFEITKQSKFKHQPEFTMNEPEDDSEEMLQKSNEYKKHNFKHSQNSKIKANVKSKNKINSSHTDLDEIYSVKDSRLHLKSQQMEKEDLRTESLKTSQNESESKTKDKFNTNEDNFSDESTQSKDYKNKNVSPILMPKQIIFNPIAGTTPSKNEQPDIYENVIVSTTEKGPIEISKMNTKYSIEDKYTDQIMRQEMSNNTQENKARPFSFKEPEHLDDNDRVNPEELATTKISPREQNGVNDNIKNLSKDNNKYSIHALTPENTVNDDKISPSKNQKGSEIINSDKFAQGLVVKTNNFKLIPNAANEEFKREYQTIQHSIQLKPAGLHISSIKDTHFENAKEVSINESSKKFGTLKYSATGKNKFAEGENQNMDRSMGKEMSKNIQENSLNNSQHFSSESEKMSDDNDSLVRNSEEHATAINLNEQDRVENKLKYSSNQTFGHFEPKDMHSSATTNYATSNSTNAYGSLSESLTRFASGAATLQATKVSNRKGFKIEHKDNLDAHEKNFLNETNLSNYKKKEKDTNVKTFPSTSPSVQNESKYQSENAEIDDDKIKYSRKETLEESNSAAITNYATPDNSTNTKNSLSEKLTMNDFENKSNSEILQAILKKVPSEDSLIHTNLSATSNDSGPIKKLQSKFNVYSIHMESSSKEQNEVAYYEIKKINGSDVGNVKSGVNESAPGEKNLDGTLGNQSLNRSSALQKSLDGETNSKDSDISDNIVSPIPSKENLSSKLLPVKKILNARYRFVPIPNLPLVKPVSFKPTVVTLNKTPLKIPTIQNERKAIAISKQTKSTPVSKPKKNNARHRSSKASTRSKQSRKNCASVFFPKSNSKQHGSNDQKTLANLQQSSILLGRILEAPFNPKFQKCLDNLMK